MSNKNECVVIYSGGTDSTCTAALMAEKYKKVHLLTFFEKGTEETPSPSKNVARLQKHFGSEKFSHQMLSTDKLVKKISYDHYFRFLLRHRFFMLSTCGFSSLSWHVRTIIYCLENNIMSVADGLTRELMHFPGHMDVIIKEFQKLYQAFGIQYTNPVRDWDTPRDHSF